MKPIQWNLHWKTALKAIEEMTLSDGHDIYMLPEPTFNAYTGFEFVNRDGTGGSIMVTIYPNIGVVEFVTYRAANRRLYMFDANQLKTHRAVFDKIFEQLALSFRGQDEPPQGTPEEYRKYWHNGKMAFEKRHLGLRNWCKIHGKLDSWGNPLIEDIEI